MFYDKRFQLTRLSLRGSRASSTLRSFLLQSTDSRQPTPQNQARGWLHATHKTVKLRAGCFIHTDRPLRLNHLCELKSTTKIDTGKCRPRLRWVLSSRPPSAVSARPKLADGDRILKKMYDVSCLVQDGPLGSIEQILYSIGQNATSTPSPIHSLQKKKREKDRCTGASICTGDCAYLALSHGLGLRRCFSPHDVRIERRVESHTRYLLPCFSFREKRVDVHFLLLDELRLPCDLWSVPVAAEVVLAFKTPQGASCFKAHSIPQTEN